MKNKITTYSLNYHKSLFTDSDNEKDYFFIQTQDHPYISEPYRAESYALEFLRKGSIIMHTKQEKKVIHAPAILTLSPTVIRSFSKNSDAIFLDIIFFKPQFFLENQTNIFFLTQYDFFDEDQLHVFKLNKKTEIKFKQLFNLIKEALLETKKQQSSILRSYLYLLIYELDSIKETSKSNDIQNPLFEKFKELVFKDFLIQKSVGYYADRLNVTPKYLSEIVKKNSGKTASEWISNMIILEAKVLLQNRELTINQISDMLHFSNQSIFGRYFKNQTGFSPLEFRKK